MKSADTSRGHNRPRPGGERRRGDAALISEVITKRGRIALRVHGSSMLPWVRPGDVALIRKADAGAVRFGDVALFLHGEHLLVHRIVRKSGGFDGEKFLTKGDAHPTADSLLGHEQLLGRVVRIFRNGQRIDMEAPRQLALALLAAKLSLMSRFWYPAARLLAVTTRPMRRLLAMIV
jgi:signal peptidase I